MEPIQDVEKMWIAEKRIKSYEVLAVTTPAGGPIIEFILDDGSKIKLTEAKFNVIKSFKKTDATTIRNQVIKAVGAKLYALMMEYGPTLPEVDHILNEAVRLTNDGTEKAINTLWGVEYAHERSLLDVNNILAAKYGEQAAQTDSAAS